MGIMIGWIIEDDLGGLSYVNYINEAWFVYKAILSYKYLQRNESPYVNSKQSMRYIHDLTL